MRRAFIVLMIWLALLPYTAAAQTSTPTPTQTPTATFTPVPEIRTLIPVGALMPWAGNSTPEGWLVADGSCIVRADYPDLFSAIGTTYGNCTGDTTLFALPDLRGRVVVGAGAGAGLTVRSPGEKFGAETHQLTVAEIPEHSHTMRHYVLNLSSTTYRLAPYVSSSTTQDAIGNLQSGLTGGGQAHNNMQPSTVVNYLIWTGTVSLELGSTTGGDETMPTPAPEIYVYATVEAGGIGQPVVFAYSVTAGDFMVSLLLLLSIGLTILRMFFKARERSA